MVDFFQRFPLLLQTLKYGEILAPEPQSTIVRGKEWEERALTGSPGPLLPCSPWPRDAILTPQKLWGEGLVGVCYPTHSTCLLRAYCVPGALLHPEDTTGI